jgi:hypothetical protein
VTHPAAKTGYVRATALDIKKLFKFNYCSSKEITRIIWYLIANKIYTKMKSDVEREKFRRGILSRLKILIDLLIKIIN